VLAGHLAVGLALDFPHYTIDFPAAQLSAWGLAPDDAYEAALGNLRRRSREPLVPAGPGVFESGWHDSHDASRICLTELVGACPVAGDPVAVAPAPTALYVTGADEADGIGLLLRLAEGHADEMRVVSPVPVRLTPGGWVALELPAGHPQATRLKAVRVRAEAAGYRRQTAAILSEQGGHGPGFVATYVPLRDKGSGEPTSRCTWSAGVPTLLPKAEWVTFMRPLGDWSYRLEAVGTWESVREEVGGLMTEVGCYPPRYRVEAFPSDEQLARINRSAGGPPELGSLET